MLPRLWDAAPRSLRITGARLQAALQAALASDEGRATAADYQKIAPPGSRMFTEILDQ
jgi:hypothetical protein